MSVRPRILLAALAVALAGYFGVTWQGSMQPGSPSLSSPPPVATRPGLAEAPVAQPPAAAVTPLGEAHSRPPGAPASRPAPIPPVLPLPESVEDRAASVEPLNPGGVGGSFSRPAGTPASVSPEPSPAPAQAMHESISTPVPEKPAPTVSPAAARQAAASAPPPARGARRLPERIALRYSVQSGEDGLSIGQAVYSGQMRDGRYALVSTTEATGITAVFVSGKIVQRSEGRVTSEGLRPEVFTSAKGEGKVKTARFDWARGQLLLPVGGVELPPQAQDLVSFPFHLAMSVEEADPAWTLSVTNGKSLRDYRFQVIGRESLALVGGRVEAVHLRGMRDGDARFDVWLAPAREWLPVRIRTLDENGKAITMTLL